jgi:hypothetical protein
VRVTWIPTRADKFCDCVVRPFFGNAHTLSYTMHFNTVLQKIIPIPHLF